MQLYCKFTDLEPMMKNKTDLGELNWVFLSMFKNVLAIFLPFHLPVAINICIISVMN